MLDLRQQGVLTGDAPKVLETVEDYMRLVEIALSHQAVMAAPELVGELRALSEAAE